MHRGYIKLWRKFFDWELANDISTAYVFLYLVAQANYKETTYLGHTIPRGSVVFSRRKLAKRLGLSEQNVRTILKHLKLTHCLTHRLTHKSTQQFSVFSIDNYDMYQDKTNPPPNPPSNSKLTTSKEVKNIKNKDMSISHPNDYDLKQSQWQTFWSVYPRKEGKAVARRSWDKLKPDDKLVEKIVEAVVNRKDSEGWRKNNGQYIPLPATYLNGRRWEDEVKDKDPYDGRVWG